MWFCLHCCDLFYAACCCRLLDVTFGVCLDLARLCASGFEFGLPQVYDTHLQLFTCLSASCIHVPRAGICTFHGVSRSGCLLRVLVSPGFNFKFYVGRNLSCFGVHRCAQFCGGVVFGLSSL